METKFKIGDEVIWRRVKSNWSRIGTERVYAVVIAVSAKRVRIKLQTGIVNALTALVDPARLERAVTARKTDGIGGYNGKD